MRKRVRWTILTTAIALFAMTATAQAAPANDNFASATTISSVPVEVSGTNVGATFQTGEPLNPAIDPADAGGASVWYSWTAPTSEEVQIHTCHGAPTLDTILAVYTGTAFSNLVPVAAGDDISLQCGHGSAAQFNAVSGTTYKIAVDGFAADQGTFKLRVSDQIPSVNIDSGPGSTTTDSTPTFTFSSDQASVTFECYVFPSVGPAEFADVCAPPFTTPVLAPGDHDFVVGAQAATGEFSFQLASHPFTLQAPPSTTPPPAATTPAATAPMATTPPKKKCKKGRKLKRGKCVKKKRKK
jgi:hypothetical protein